jgi:hypothetical protein
MGVFDPEQFLNSTFTEQLDTRLIPPPVGEFPGICGEPSTRESNAKDGSGRVYTWFDTPIELDDPAVKEVTGRDKTIVRYSVSLDLKEDGSLDRSKGKNIGLGRLLEAVGLKGQSWSPKAIQGRPLKAKIGHKFVDGEIMAEVKGVAPL